MANEFNPSSYGFQDAGDGRLFIPFSSTRYGQEQPGAATLPEGNDPNPNAGKYSLITGTGSDATTNYYDSLADYYKAVAPRGPNLSNIRYNEAGTNNPSYFAYNTSGQTPEQFTGSHNGELGYYLDPKRLGYYEQSPGSAWNDFRSGALPVLLAAAGGALAAPEAGAGAGAAAEGGAAAGNAAQGLQMTGSTAAEGMGGGTGLTAAGSGGGTGLQLTPAAQSALNTGMSSALPNILGSGTTGTQNVAQGLQLSPQAQNTLGTSGGVPNTTGAPTTPGGAPAAGGNPTGGGQSFVDQIIAELKKNAIPLGLSALSMAQGSRQKDMPNQQQQQAGGNAASGLGTDYINAARSGNLMPWQQSGLEQYTQQAKNQINQYFASIGQFDSTARMQALAQVDQQAQIMKGQLLQQTLSSGLQALGAAQGPFSQIANYQLQQDRDLQNAMGNFARSVGGLFGSQAGKPTAQPTPAPSGGGQVNTNPQPYITEQTPQNIQGNP